MEKVTSLLEKYDYFRAAQLRSINPTSESSKILTLVIQDDEGEDTDRITIEFKDIKSSKILVNSVLPMLDMMGGISLIKENNLYGFSLGRDTAMLHVQNAPLYIIASDITITEAQLNN
ncbi:MAG: Unknown protein [uncultured Sulfurovum sp.]|uniref:Uncharacterized protein n=1 Tax=uncultured Sulfurovum sp. TaxID=269237 RepID=A0A6S6ST65_9BACT|nr:MAG: Unknown protein [uncultured Sulfurovum sp.]